MTPSELMADYIQRSAKFTKDTLSDFSDADLLARPCPGANHAAWQLGHLTCVTNGMFATCGADMPSLPKAFEEKYCGETTKNDDPKFFHKKAELIETFDKVLAAAAQFAKTRRPEDLDKPTAEKLRGWCPTIGHLILTTPMHIGMHTGQIQAIRRKLGKPVLF